MVAVTSAVVIFDPESSSRDALSFGFEREDFEVFATSSADEAQEMVRVAGAPLLVVSIGVGSATRAEALSFIGTLRDDPARKGLAVVALGRRDTREDALRAGADEFVSWPAFIRDAVTLSRLAIATRADSMGGGLSGLIEDYEVYFLIRALAAAGRSAVIELERAGHKGQIHMVRGEIAHARVGRLSGVGAFHHLLLWAEAALRLRFTTPPGERKIDVHIEDLLQSGVHFVGEFEKLAQRVGGPQAMFERRVDRLRDPSFDDSKVPPAVRSFAEAVPTGATLVDLVELSPFKPFDTIKVCYRLCELGLIAKRDPVRSISPLTAQLAVRDWLLGTATPEPRSTVTEAGRRAAEAYAEAASQRAQAEPAPADELFTAPPSRTAPSRTAASRTAASRTAATPSPARHTPPIPTPVAEDAPTAPREAARGPSARNKSKQGKSKTQLAKAAAPSADAPSDTGKTARFPREAVEEAAVQEPVFDEVDEAFFAREAEIGQVDPVENFDDLDHTGAQRKLSQKRKWSLFGDKPAPKPAPRKKR